MNETKNMDSRLTQYVCSNPDMNCSWNDVAKLERQLGKLGVIVTSVQAFAQGVAGSMDGLSSLGYKDLVANGLNVNDDRLYFLLQVVGNSSWQTAAQLVTDLAPANYNAVWKVMSDLFPGAGAQGMAASAIANLPGVSGVINAALSAA